MTHRHHSLRHHPFTSALPAAALCMALLITALMTAPAAAQTAGKTWEFGFDVGSAGISDDDELELDFRSGVRAGYFVNDTVELELQYFQADALFDSNLRAGMANVVIHLSPERRVATYLLAGAGYSRLEDVDFLGLGDGDESDSGTAYQAGAGVRIFLGSGGSMALRLEASNLWTDTDLFGSTSNGSLTAGLSWSFGS